MSITDINCPQWRKLNSYHIFLKRGRKSIRVTHNIFKVQCHYACKHSLSVLWDFIIFLKFVPLFLMCRFNKVINIKKLLFLKQDWIILLVNFISLLIVYLHFCQLQHHLDAENGENSEKRYQPTDYAAPRRSKK